MNSAANLRERLVGREALEGGFDLRDHAVEPGHLARAVDDHRHTERSLDDEGRIARLEPQRVYVGLEFGRLLLENGGVGPKLVAAHTSRVAARRNEPFDFEPEQPVQIAAGVRGGDVLDDTALSITLARIALEIRMQFLGEPPVDRAQGILPQLFGLASPLFCCAGPFPVSRSLCRNVLIPPWEPISSPPEIALTARRTKHRTKNEEQGTARGTRNEETTNDVQALAVSQKHSNHSAPLGTNFA
jgi:hypothetical protein